MAFDDILAQRVRGRLAALDGYDEKKMFGGLCFLLHGNMACGLLGDELIVRVGPAAFAEALDRPHTRLFDVTGRPMRGWVVVAAAGLRDDAALQEWIARGTTYALSLPPKGHK